MKFLTCCWLRLLPAQMSFHSSPTPAQSFHAPPVALCSPPHPAGWTNTFLVSVVDAH